MTVQKQEGPLDHHGDGKPTACVKSTNEWLHYLTVRCPRGVSGWLHVTRRTDHGGHPICSAIGPDTVRTWLGNNSLAFQTPELSKRVGYTFTHKNGHHSNWHGAMVWKDIPWRTYCLLQTSANKQLHNLTVKRPGSISMLLKVTRRSDHGGHPICSAILPETVRTWLGNNSLAFQTPKLSKRVGYTFTHKNGHHSNWHGAMVWKDIPWRTYCLAANICKQAAPQSHCQAPWQHQHVAESHSA